MGSGRSKPGTKGGAGGADRRASVKAATARPGGARHAPRRGRRKPTARDGHGGQNEKRTSMAHDETQKATESLFKLHFCVVRMIWGLLVAVHQGKLRLWRELFVANAADANVSLSKVSTFQFQYVSICFDVSASLYISCSWQQLAAGNKLSEQAELQKFFGLALPRRQHYPQLPDLAFTLCTKPGPPIEGSKCYQRLCTTIKHSL